MGFARLGGKARPSLKLGDGAGVERWAELTAYGLKNSDGETVFTSAFNGDTNRAWVLSGEAFQSVETGSLWRFAWANTGKRVPFRLAPHGNAMASATQPHYTGTVIVGPKPDLGGAAEDETFIFAFEWALTAPPVEVTA